MQAMQGTQGAYNEARSEKLTDGKFEQAWKVAMLQELHYNKKTQARWKKFLSK
jgi:hypothetical protein